MTKNSIKSALIKTIKLNYKYPDDLHSNFISNLVIQHTSENFILSFFEVWPPPIIGISEEEKQLKLDSLDEVEAKCVSRIVITPGKMRDFIEAMKINLARFESTSEKLPEEVEE